MSAADGFTPDAAIVVDDSYADSWWNAHVKGDAYVVPELALRAHLKPNGRESEWKDFVRWIARKCPRSKGARVYVTRANWGAVIEHFGRAA